MPLPFQGPGDPALVKGSKLPIEQPDSFQFVRGQGWTTIKSFEGATKDGIFGKAQEMVDALFTNVRVEKVNGVWRVEGRVEGQGQGEPPPDGEENEVWEMDSLSESVHISNHPMFQALDDELIRTILDAAENPTTGEAPSFDDSASGILAEKLYKLLIRKVDTYNYEVPLLRHTLTPAPSSVDVDGRLEVWTPDQIGVTTPAIAGMVLQFYNSNPFGDVVDHTWGWMNNTLRVTEDVHGRSQLVEEWMLANWHNDIYPNF